MRFLNESSNNYIQLLPYFLPSIDTVTHRLVIAFGWLHYSFFILIGKNTKP